MPPSTRYTVRLPHALDAQVQARVHAGTPFAMLIREALSAYLTDTMPTEAPTPADTRADTVQALQEQLAALTIRVEALEQASTPRRHRADRVLTRADTSADTPPTGADTVALPYDPDAAFARMQALQAQGLTLAQIAAQMTAEGWRTKHGRPWHKSTVAYVLKTHGR